MIIERFLREIAFASELDHPQIPKVLGSGVIDGVPYYVMSYVEGEPLRRLIDREKQLPVADALRIACEVIKPTAYAHKRGIIHRDLKPENIFISDKGVFVLDFGISPGNYRVGRGPSYVDGSRYGHAGVHESRASAWRSRSRCAHRHLFARLRVVRDDRGHSAFRWSDCTGGDFRADSLETHRH